MVYSHSRPYTYIAAQWDKDSSAVEILKKWNADKSKALSFKDAHDLVQARDSSLNCNIKKSLASRLDESFRFILIVGDGTNALRSGACHLCPSYNSYTKYCAKVYPVKLYPVKRTRERVTFEPTSPVYGR